MRTLLSERFAPITSSIGFLELSLDDVADGLETWRRRLYGDVSVSRPTDGFPEVLHLLEPLTVGCRPRELLIAASPRWTAYFDCGLRGTDAVSAIGHLSRTLQCQGLAVDVAPHILNRSGTRPSRMGAVQFELFGPLKTGFLNYVRTVSVAFDGSRWQFNANGTVQDFEESDAYRVRRVRDRFTSQMLERYCRALGIDVFDIDFYGPDAVLIESAVTPAPGRDVMWLAQVQEWLGIVPGVADSLPG